MSLRNFITVVLTCVVVSFAAWDGSTTLEPSTTSIEGRRFYAIGSPEELAWFAKTVNLGDTAISAILVADIDLNSKNWTPIGKDSVVAFDGIFDGDGHSISGINVSSKMYAGLFGIIDVGTVKNLVVENSKISGYYLKNNYYYSYVGSVAGYAKAKSSIQNVVNKTALAAATNKPSSGTSYLYMGGIVGYTRGKIIDCANEANLSQSGSSQYIGGIVGYANYANLENLKNSGVIEGVDYTGGIVGYADDTKGLNLRNTGKISGKYRVGGVAAYGDDSPMTNAFNDGNVEGKKLVGGICGECDGKITNSANNGIVTGIGLSKDSLRIGGICGFCNAVDSSQNHGSIEVEGTYLRNAYVGGISGISSQVRMSLNYGTVSVIADSTLYIGGISGFVNGYYSVSYCGNYGKIKGSTTSKTKEAHVGGIVGKVGNYGLSNVFNQGALYSSHYAAGIATVLPQNSITIKNFYVATDTIDAPNAAAFVNYNSTTATLQNGYLDGSLIKNKPLIGENVGVEKDLFVVDTKTMQSDSLAYILDIANYSGNYKSSFYTSTWSDPTCHWSRDVGYPIFKDSVHNPIYQITFISHKKCSSTSCELDSVKRYTNYKRLIDPFSQLNDGSIWILDNQLFIKRNSPSISKDYKFDWSDSLVIATYKKCNDLASTDMGCCINYMLDFQEEYANAYNTYIERFSQVYEDLYGNTPNYTYFSKDSIAMSYCLDDNGDGLLNWSDSSSRSYTSYNTMKTSIASYKQAYNQLLSSSSFAGTSSSSSNSQAILNARALFMPKVFVNGRFIQIENMNSREKIVVFDAQGRIVKKLPNPSSKMYVNVPFAGRYFVMIGKSITAIDVK